MFDGMSIYGSYPCKEGCRTAAIEWNLQRNCKNRQLCVLSCVVSRRVPSLLFIMPRVPYENHTFSLNSTLNLQAFESAPASMNTFTLNSTTRQPRRRAESMSWSRQTSTTQVSSELTSAQTSPTSSPYTPFYPNRTWQRRGDGFAGWFGRYWTRVGTRLLSHHVTFRFLYVV